MSKTKFCNCRSSPQFSCQLGMSSKTPLACRSKNPSSYLPLLRRRGRACQKSRARIRSFPFQYRQTIGSAPLRAGTRAATIATGVIGQRAIAINFRRGATKESRAASTTGRTTAATTAITATPPPAITTTTKKTKAIEISTEAAKTTATPATTTTTEEGASTRAGTTTSEASGAATAGATPGPTLVLGRTRTRSRTPTNTSRTWRFNSR